MNLDITGVYSFVIPFQTMFLNTEIKITHHNIITEFGESFFLHRCVDDYFEPIQSIILGNGTRHPKRTDTKLGNKRYSKKCVCNTENNKKQVVLTANFTVEQVLESTEIGVSTLNRNKEEILISHDVFDEFDSTVFAGITGDVSVEYIYQFTTTYQKNNWTLFDETNMVYYAYEENNVITVFENNIGYREVSDIPSVGNTPGVFFYDSVSKILYIRPISDVNTSDIIIQI